MKLWSALSTVLLALGWFASGCAHQPQIDWNTRVGNYTFDQAVLELGPPDKSAKLGDDTLVAEWMTLRGRSGAMRVTGVGGGWGRYHGPSSFWIIDEPPMPDRFLRLTFGPDGKLSGWKRVYR